MDQSSLNQRSLKNDHKCQWTNHVAQKMRYYGISESLIKRIVRFPKRTQYGIAPDTVAVMQPTANKKKPQEIWVMYQEKSQKKYHVSGITYQGKQNAAMEKAMEKINTLENKKIIISAWRYPGVTPVGKEFHLPDDVMADLVNFDTL